MKMNLLLLLTTFMFISAPVFAARPRQCNSQKTCDSGKTCIENNCLIDSTSVKITLSWTSGTDLDLYVRTPTGEEISQSNMKDGGGTLHRDACFNAETCASSEDTHPHVEHVYWNPTVKKVKGIYSVWVENTAGTTSAEYTIVFEDPSGKRTYKRGTIGPKKQEKSIKYKFEIKHDLECDKDTDGDGLCDKWETEGIDLNGDGIIDLDLKKLGADPNHKDVFVEVDWIKGNKPRSLRAVKKAFENAAVKNPDKINGIKLHILLSDEITEINGVAVKRKQALDINFLKTAAYDGKTNACGWFGSKTDRKSSNCEWISKAREKVYRYVIYGYKHTGGALGEATDIPGRGFILTAFHNNEYKTKKMLADTFLHELGHTLGLHHGGPDNLNCKPNYLSTMNYIYDALAYPRSIDYSKHLTPSLDENLLVESEGMRGPSDWKKVFFGDDTIATHTNEFKNADTAEVDWDSNNIISSLATVKVNISRVPFGGCSSDTSYDSLHSQNDWDHLVFNFRPTEGDRFKTVVEGVKEPTVEDRLAFLELIDTDEDGVSNRYDVCLTVSDPDQKDTDGDGVGDACDDCPEDSAPYEENGCPEQDPDEEQNSENADEFDTHEGAENSGSNDSLQNDGAPSLINAKTGGCNTTPTNPPLGLTLIVLLGLLSVSLPRTSTLSRR